MRLRNCGWRLQVAVALMKKLGTRFGRPMNVEAAYFADSLYNAWQMEYKTCKIGILLVISVVDREVIHHWSTKLFCFVRQQETGKEGSVIAH